MLPAACSWNRNRCVCHRVRLLLDRVVCCTAMLNVQTTRVPVCDCPSQMVAMVDLWRKSWSKEEGTTDPLAPFGIVTLASGGSEGGTDIGGMRWSQTGTSHGHHHHHHTSCCSTSSKAAEIALRIRILRENHSRSRNLNRAVEQHNTQPPQ